MKNYTEEEIKTKIEELTKKQSTELIQLIELEESKEDERNAQLSKIEDLAEREKLDQEFGYFYHNLIIFF